MENVQDPSIQRRDHVSVGLSFINEAENGASRADSRIRGFGHDNRALG
jgi:hypothetical protein